MRRFHRITSLAVLLALSGALAGCGGGGLSNFDPTDLLDFLDTKKKLPGDRKPVFPQGVPGLTPGGARCSAAGRAGRRAEGSQGRGEIPRCGPGRAAGCQRVAR